MKSERERIIIKKDISTLKEFFEIYCKNNHNGLTIFLPSSIIKNYFSEKIYLCKECKSQFLYASAKRIICPYYPKPTCKKCPSVCYSNEHRRFMKEMMKFSGRYLITHGRIDLIFKYLF